MKVIKKLYNKGIELEINRKYTEAVKWYCFYNKSY